MVYLLISWLIAILLFSVYISRDNEYRLRGFVVVIMVMIWFFSSKLLDVGGYVSNIWNILYAGVMLLQFVILEKLGKKFAIDTVKMVYYNLGLAFLIAYFIFLFPTVLGNEIASDHVNYIANSNLRVITWSFSAFYLWQMVFIIAHEKLKHLSIFTRYTVPMILAQIVDSFVFFPVAFFWTGLPILQILSVGIIFKVIVWVIMFLIVPHVIRQK